jgi:hypothetical protein
MTNTPMMKAIITIDAALRKALFSGGASLLQYPNNLTTRSLN